MHLSPLTSLGPDLKQYILTNVPPRDMYNVGSVNKEFHQLFKAEQQRHVDFIHNLTDDAIDHIITTWVESPDDTIEMYRLIKYVSDENIPRLRDLCHAIYKRAENITTIHPALERITIIRVVDNVVHFSLWKLKFLLFTTTHDGIEELTPDMLNERRVLLINHTATVFTQHTEVERPTYALYVLILHRLIPKGRFTKLTLRLHATEATLQSVALNINHEKVMEMMQEVPWDITVEYHAGIINDESHRKSLLPPTLRNLHCVANNTFAGQFSYARTFAPFVISSY